MTQSARDIIARSIAMHPSLFIEMLTKQTQLHDEYFSSLTASLQGRQGAKTARDHCKAAAAMTRVGNIDGILSDSGPLFVALSVACKLQGLPPSVRTAAIAACNPLKTGEA